MHVLRYMGGKNRLLPFILPEIEALAPPGAPVCDLMAGTHAVGYALKARHPVLANDVQGYSRVIGEALLAKSSVRISRETAAEVLERLSAVRRDERYTLFQKLYSDTYFSATQCAEIDHLRGAIEGIADPVRRSMYLTCLMSAMCYVQSTPGHFAQYLPPHHPRAAYLRGLSITRAFLDKCEDFAGLVQGPHECRVTALEYRAFLAAHHDLLHDVAVFYVDPPYTADQYSRFYHVLETLVRYDNPAVRHKGRYRTDRFRSEFCLRSRVAAAFRELFARLAAFPRAAVVLSYGSRGLLAIDELAALGREHYSNVAVRRRPYRHSTQGKGPVPAVEYLLILENRPAYSFSAGIGRHR